LLRRLQVGSDPKRLESVRDRMVPRGSSIVVYLLMAVFGCGSKPDDLRQDGISAPASWHVTEAPTLSIGGIETQLHGDLHRVAATVLLDDGRLVVADGAQRLLYFDGCGRTRQEPGPPLVRSSRGSWSALIEFIF
jgi:hypothetical protein